MNQRRSGNKQVSVVQHLIAGTQLGLDLGRLERNSLIDGENDLNRGQKTVYSLDLMIRIATTPGTKVQLGEGNHADTYGQFASQQLLQGVFTPTVASEDADEDT